MSKNRSKFESVTPFWRTRESQAGAIDFDRRFAQSGGRKRMRGAPWRWGRICKIERTGMMESPNAELNPGHSTGGSWGESESGRNLKAKHLRGAYGSHWSEARKRLLGGVNEHMRQIHHMWQIVKGFVETCLHSSKVAGHKAFAEKRVFRIPPSRDMWQLQRICWETRIRKIERTGMTGASNAGLNPGHSAGGSWSESENRSEFESETP